VTDVAHTLPRPGAVFAEQLRVVGLAVRREALALAAVLVLIGLIVFIDSWGDGQAANGMPAPPITMIALGALAPFAVWKGEQVFGGAHMWTLPVERRLHGLSRVLAGGVWLLVAVALIQLWMLAVSLATGGVVNGEEVRMLVGPGGVEDLTPVRWSTPAWGWLTPFTTASICYLIGSAFILGVRHPLRWGVAAVAAFVGFAFITEEVLSGGVLQSVFDFITDGPVGMNEAMGIGVADEVERPDGTPLGLWYKLPSLRGWAPAALAWATIASAMLWAAASRHRET
jgi:hypothetical protein